MARVPAGSVFLLSDYGLADEFAGVMHAVVLRHAPDAPVVDLTHEVAPSDIRAGALALVRSVPHLGHGVVLAVVDPGVGTGRRAVAVAVDAPGGPGFLLGPDNGLLPWAADALGGARAAVDLGGARAAVDLGAPRPAPGGRAVSGVSTFDGRDVFAPAAARLWEGADLSDLGTPIPVADLVRLPAPRLVVTAGSLDTEVVWVDRFGNAQLSATPADAGAAGIEEAVELTAAGAARRLRLVGAFAQLAGDEAGLMVDANGHLALVCNRRSAATVLDVRTGDVVKLRPLPSVPPTPPAPRSGRAP